MATPTRAGFRSAFPEFATSTDDATVDRWLERARLMHNVLDEATYLLCAHMLTLDAQEDKEDVGGSGELITEQVGQQLATYAPHAKRPGEEFFTRTSYGRFFLELERRIPRKAYSAFVA